MYKIILSFMVLAVIAGSFSVNAGVYSEQLRNNFYFTMEPNSEKCFSLKISNDFRTDKMDSYKMDIATDAETNINSIVTGAGDGNVVTLPICFYSNGRREGDFSRWSILIRSESCHVGEVWNGGLCISDIDGVTESEKQGNPCDLINDLPHLFDYFLSTEHRSNVGEQVKIPLIISSYRDVDMEVSVSSGLNVTPKNSFYHLDGAKTIDLVAKADVKGVYDINVSLNVVIDGEYCDLDFCKKQLSTKLYVGVTPTRTRTGWKFSAVPRFPSVTKIQPVAFLLLVENFDSQRDFSLGVNLPNGLETGFTGESFTLQTGEKKQIEVNVTPQDVRPATYPIEFVAKSDVETRDVVYLLMQEIKSSINRKLNQLYGSSNDPQAGQIKTIINTMLPGVSGSKFDPDAYKNIQNVLSGTAIPGNITKTNQTTSVSTSSSQPIDPITIAIPIIVIALIIILVIYKKLKVVEEEEFRY